MELAVVNYMPRNIKVLSLIPTKLYIFPLTVSANEDDTFSKCNIDAAYKDFKLQIHLTKGRCVHNPWIKFYMDCLTHVEKNCVWRVLP